jgi:hypothetical protein
VALRARSVVVMTGWRRLRRQTVRFAGARGSAANRLSGRDPLMQDMFAPANKT